MNVRIVLSILAVASGSVGRAQPSVVPEMPPPVILQDAPLSVDRHWVGVSLLLGWSERAALPRQFTFPATGGRIEMPRQKDPVVTAGITLQGGFCFGDTLKHGIDASFLNLGNWYETDSSNITVTPTGPVPAGSAELASRYGTGDVNYRRRLFQSQNWRFDGLLGYRYAGLWDQATVNHTYYSFNTPTLSVMRLKDTAESFNDFNGGQFGLSGTYSNGAWLFSATGKIALGGLHSCVEYHGASTVFANLPDGVTLYTNDRFAVLPSVSLMLSRQVWTHGRVTVGYEFQYLNGVARAADTFQDTMPEFDSSFWAQGLTLGFEWRY